MPDPKTITIAIPTDAETLDPHEADDSVSFGILNQILEGLTRFSDHSIQVEPALAERWIHSDDFRIWTFHLRSGIQFSDGTPVTAAAVLESFSSVKAFGGKISVSDPKTIVFHLQEPNAQFDETLSQLSFSVVRVSGAARIGTGPYRLDSRRAGREIVLVRNEKNTRLGAKIDRIVFRVIPYMTLLSRALADGEVDLTDSVTPSMLSVLRNSPKIRLEYQMGLNTGFLCINTSKPPLSDKRLRTGIAHAIDRTPLIQRFFPTGYGEPARTLLPPQLQRGKIRDFHAYDPEAARRLVAESGYHGEPLRLCPSWAPRPYMPDPPAIAHDIAKMLVAVGMNVKDESTPVAEEFFNRQGNGDFDLMLSGWIADDTIPHNFLADNLSSSRIGRTNVPRYREGSFDALLSRMRRSKGVDSEAAVTEAVDLIYRDVPLVPLFHGPQIAAAGPRVLGKILHPSSSLRVWSLTIQ